MPHDNHVIDHINKDVDSLLMDGVYSRSDAREYYLNMTKDWEDRHPYDCLLSAKIWSCWRFNH